MNAKSSKGSITVFVLVGLLFMTGFLIISFGSNVNKSKSAKEQFDILSSIYSHGDTDVKAYERAYTAIRKKKAQTLTASIENNSVLELRKTFSNKIGNIKIYGNINRVGNFISDIADSNYGKYLVKVNVTNEDGSVEKTNNIYLTSPLEKTNTYIDYINYENKNVVRLQIDSQTETILETISLTEIIDIYEDYTKIEVVTDIAPSKIEATYFGYTME